MREEVMALQLWRFVIKSGDPLQFPRRREYFVDGFDGNDALSGLIDLLDSRGISLDDGDVIEMGLVEE